MNLSTTSEDASLYSFIVIVPFPVSIIYIRTNKLTIGHLALYIFYTKSVLTYLSQFLFQLSNIGFTSAAIMVMAGGPHPLLFCGPHLPLTQWQGPAITIMAADVNPSNIGIFLLKLFIN
jgi:hypothetical protein